jgi:hypothetical protein
VTAFHIDGPATQLPRFDALAAGQNRQKYGRAIKLLAGLRLLHGR